MGWVLGVCLGVIYKTFQGEVKIQTQEVIVDKRAARPVFDISRGTPTTSSAFPHPLSSGHQKADSYFHLICIDIKTIKSPFLFLALDLPPAPIFQDINEKRIIPQVPLGTLLAKYDGVTTQVSIHQFTSVHIDLRPTGTFHTDVILADMRY